jgi:hypothetical protein
VRGWDLLAECVIRVGEQAPARVTLAALDVGSGASKLDVCVVERPPPGHTGPWHLVGPPLFSQQVSALSHLRPYCTAARSAVQTLNPR